MRGRAPHNPHTIVLNRQNHLTLITLSQVDAHGFGLGVMQYIGERLTNDMQDMDFLVRAEATDIQVHFQIHLKVAAVRKFIDRTQQRLLQRPVFHLYAERGKQLAQLPVGAIQALAHLLEDISDRRDPCSGFRLALQQFTHPIDLDLHVRQGLR